MLHEKTKQKFRYKAMLRLSVLLLVISLFAAVFGFGEIDGGVASVGKLLFFIFLALFVLSLVLGASIFKR
jgi:uncharacterized membrane protein YtjA (UPF0391 family)